MSERVLRRLDELYAIDGGPGANRPGLSAAEQEAHDLVAGWMEKAGLAVSVDPAGNLFGRLPGVDASDEVWAGSHLDSVPQGGRFDGALGVVAALEAVERLGPQDRTLAVVSFRDEEGWRFGHGCFGSRALCGALEAAELGTADEEGVTIAEAVRSLGFGPVPEGGWLERPPGAFVELHVEQGPVLAAQDVPLGIVTSIVGLARLRVAFEGQGGHAGTTPMAGRRDALAAAARFVLAVKSAAERHEPAVATIGQLAVEPNAANVIPARVELLVDAAHPPTEHSRRWSARSKPRRKARTSSGWDGCGRPRCIRTSAPRFALRSKSSACPPSSCRPARATTRASSQRPACLRRCSSFAAARAA